MDYWDCPSLSLVQCRQWTTSDATHFQTKVLSSCREPWCLFIWMTPPSCPFLPLSPPPFIFLPLPTPSLFSLCLPPLHPPHPIPSSPLLPPSSLFPLPHSHFPSPIPHSCSLLPLRTAHSLFPPPCLLTRFALQPICFYFVHLWLDDAHTNDLLSKQHGITWVPGPFCRIPATPPLPRSGGHQSIHQFGRKFPLMVIRSLDLVLERIQLPIASCY